MSTRVSTLTGAVISSVAFHNFKALREARVELQPFNLIVGPNGSGKTSLIQALLRLRTLARTAGSSTGRQRMPVRLAPARQIGETASPSLEFRFMPPHERALARLSCVEQWICDQIEFSGVTESARGALLGKIEGIRAYLFDHYAMAEPIVYSTAEEQGATARQREARSKKGSEPLAQNGGNLAAVLAALRKSHPENFAQLEAELRQIVPEFAGIEISHNGGQTDGSEMVSLGLRLRDTGGASASGEVVTADNLSQGTLYLLAVLFLVFQPEPPSVVCIEEIDRGMHPRWLRSLRDLLYRLSYPRDFGESRAPVQVLATTHSPYLLDLFKDHPEEIIISHKHGLSAHFERLSDRTDLGSLLGEASLGDLWFSGILGGVPEEETF